MQVFHFSPEKPNWKSYVTHLRHSGQARWVLDERDRPKFEEMVLLGIEQDGAVVASLTLKVQPIVIPASADVDTRLLAGSPNSTHGQDAVVSVYNNGGSTFRWLPTIPESGRYQVYAWWTYRSNRSASVPYNIVHDGGVGTVIVDQRDPALSGQWILLGRYSFTDIINNSALGDVSVEGVRPTASADAVVVAAAECGTGVVGLVHDTAAHRPAVLLLQWMRH